MPTNSRTKISIPPPDLTNEAEWKRKVADWIKEANQGNLNNTGNVTLVANSGTTLVVEPRAGNFSFIGLMPTTANAAAELGNGTLYISLQGKQLFQITHANNAQTDRTFTYVILG